MIRSSIDKGAPVQYGCPYDTKPLSYTSSEDVSFSERVGSVGSGVRNLTAARDAERAIVDGDTDIEALAAVEDGKYEATA
jgi:hypothetical protein